MNSLRTNTTLRIGLVLATLLSWFVLSNRCALGQLLSARQANVMQHQCCDKKERQQKKAPPSSDSLDCCKVFHALNSATTKAPVLELVMLGTMTFASAVEIASADVHLVVLADTGPPGAASFTELVLHRSLRSHAPPICT